MNTLYKRIWNEDQGVLTFEWVLLITLLVVGIVGGVSAVRDAVVDEMGDVAAAALRIDQSYTVMAEGCTDPGAEPLGNAFGYRDSVPSCAPKRERAKVDSDNSQTVGECGH